ncbi:MAG: Spy/CpxP family protein refolding chaperone [Xanthobacteraceae bacterium]
MLKPVIAATAMLAITGSSIVYAQQRFGDHRGFENGPRAELRHRLTADDVAAFADARIAALKAGLELTPDQAKNWPAFEQALRDMVQLRIQRVKAREARDQQGQTPQQGQAPSSPFDRLGRRADNMAKTSAALKHVADGGAPLYQSLSDAQKSRFTMLSRLLRPHHRMQGNEGGWRQGQWDGRDGHGFGRDGEHEDHRFGENGRGPGGGMHHHLMGNDGDQGSRL